MSRAFSRYEVWTQTESGNPSSETRARTEKHLEPIARSSSARSRRDVRRGGSTSKITWAKDREKRVSTTRTPSAGMARAVLSSASKAAASSSGPRLCHQNAFLTCRPFGG